MEQTNIESRLLQARSAVCPTNLEALTEFCDHVGIEKQGMGIGAGHTHQSNKGSGQMVRRGVWRRKQKTHCPLTLEQFAEKVPSEQKQAKGTEKIESPKAAVKSGVLEVRNPTSDMAMEFKKTDTKVLTGMHHSERNSKSMDRLMQREAFPSYH